MSRIKRRLYNYNLSHNCNTTTQMGKLIPIGLMQTLPGDIFKLSTSALIRVSPMMKPVMHPIRAEIRHFYVPHRLVWEDWEDFITGGKDGLSTPDMPYFNVDNVASRSLLDYYGVPVGSFTGTRELSALPIRGYNLIYNYWFRDQDLIPEVEIGMESGLDTTTPIDIHRVAWSKDYFTVARPWAQKGPQVTVGLSDMAPVYASASGSSLVDPAAVSRTTAAGAYGYLFDQKQRHLQVAYPDTVLRADLSQAGAISAVDLRLAFQMQSMFEELSRTGNRYTDVLKSQWGIHIRDETIQEPIYIGGDKQTIQISEVVQTSSSADTILGELGGHGIGALGSGRDTFKAMEHGFIHTFLYIRPESIYMQALPRFWSYKIREDFYNPYFALIGQQEVFNRELNAFHLEPDGVFGYADRYDEYRSQPSIVTGEFRTIEKDWHLARELPNDVALNESFITCSPSNRIFAEQSGDYDHFQCMNYHRIQALRAVIKDPKPQLGM